MWERKYCYSNLGKQANGAPLFRTDANHLNVNGALYVAKEIAPKILELLKTLNKQGITIIIVTHDDKISQSCNRIITMKDGMIINSKTSRFIFRLLVFVNIIK